MGIGEDLGIAVGRNVGTSGSLLSPPTPPSEVTGIFVDATLSGNITDGTYNSTARDNSGSQGNAYTTIQAAVDNFSTVLPSSRTIWIRGGTYLESVEIHGQNVPDGTVSQWNTLASFPLEWAIIDNQHINSYTVGKPASGRNLPRDFAYWRFIRLEITGGMNETAEGYAGLYISGGPFIVRYCYIHDNHIASSYGGNNPAGVVGYCWQDSYLEFNWIADNGHLTATDPNFCNVTIIPDYDYDYVAEFGYPNSLRSTERNIYRYNKVTGSVVGMRDKTYTFFTGRDVGGNDYDDTYSTYGCSWHHNYVEGAYRHGILCKTDFSQIHHNIIENVSESLPTPHQPSWMMYKVLNYNNTIISPDKGITRFSADMSTVTINMNPALYGYDYNNIITDCSDKTSGASDWLIGTPINAMCHGNRTQVTNPDLTNYICSNNYIYHPNEADPADVFTYNSDYLDVTAYRNETEFEAETDIGSPREMYYKHTGGTALFEADGYTTIGTHVMEGTDTIAAGGINIAHPYLAGITIPDYVGATDPDNNAWVSAVVDMDVAWLTAQDGDTLPSWTE